MSNRHDFSAFSSRLHFHGTLKFESGFRIGASRSTKVDEPDLPVLRDALGQPYIPGSSFKGAIRSYIEAILRTLQADEKVDDRNLACLSVGKPKDRDGKDLSGLCLTQNEVKLLKDAAAAKWADLDKLPPHLQTRLENLPTPPKEQAPEARLDAALWDLSCWTCRVFGASWLASKVAIRDLPLVTDEITWPAETRDGVAIDRDSGRAADGMKYQFEALAAGAPFHLEILVENASDPELGLLWLGLSAFKRGEIQLGGARSRGLGWCKLTPDWAGSRYIDKTNLLDTLFAPQPPASNVNLEKTTQWVQAFGQAIGASKGGSHA